MKHSILMLAGGALAMSLPGAALADAVMLSATLDGASETKGGHPDGSGSFEAELDAESGDLCYVLAVADIGDVMAAHIHAGAAGKDGKPVVTIEVTGEDEDLCVAVEPDALKPIIAAPSGYYVNVHTKDFPAGAIRGQLEKSE